ncbi:ribonuclease H-like domain-containing protein [Tanacetum coccineum]
MINISNTSTATHGPIQYTMHTAGPVALTTATHWPIQPLAQPRKMPDRLTLCGNSGSFANRGNDFMTRRVLLRYDSTGDLYPVTKPSTIPHALLTNQFTWHQRLGHPGSEVLRRLFSSNSILCTKEKAPVLCHAFQLGKHVRLLFIKSTTFVNSCINKVEFLEVGRLCRAAPIGCEEVMSE